MFVRFSHVMLFARDHARTVQWYCDTLGYEIDYHAPGQFASLHHAKLGRLAIHSGASTPAGGKSPMPYLLCEDIRGTLADLKAKGVRTTEPMQVGESPWHAHFFDPEGNEWGVEEV